MSASTQCTVALELGYPEKIVKRALRKYKFKDAGSLLEYVDTHMDELEGEEDEEEKEEPPPEEKKITILPTHEKSVASAANTGPDQKRKLSLKEETEILYRQSKCVKCLENARTFLCLPCCHFTLCDACEKTSRACPLRDSQEAIAATIRTYAAF